MQMRPPLQIQSMLKAMNDVVLPAVDPDNKLAQEQARLIMGMLNLMARQIPLQFRFDCDELGRLIEFAGALDASAEGGAAVQQARAQMNDCRESAGTTLEQARVSPAQVESAVRDLRQATGALISAAYGDAPPEALARIEKTVLSMSAEQLLRERSWVLVQGWEPDPAAVPPIETLLAGAGA